MYYVEIIDTYVCDRLLQQQRVNTYEKHSYHVGNFLKTIWIPPRWEILSEFKA